MKGVAFYLFVYGFMTIGAFAVLIVLQRQGIIGDELDDLNGLYRRSPLSALVLLIFMLSLAGIPPLAGFVGKYFILQALIETGHIRLALFGALYIVPALYYYFRIVAHAYLYEPGNAPLPIVTIGQRVAFAVMCFVTVAAGIYPGAVRAPGDVLAVLPIRFQWPLKTQSRLPPHRRENGPQKVCARFSDIMELPFLLVASVAHWRRSGIFPGQAFSHLARFYSDSWVCWALPAGMIQLVRRVVKGHLGRWRSRIPFYVAAERRIEWMTLAFGLAGPCLSSCAGAGVPEREWRLAQRSRG